MLDMTGKSLFPDWKQKKMKILKKIENFEKKFLKIFF